MQWAVGHLHYNRWHCGLTKQCLLQSREKDSWCHGALWPSPRHGLSCASACPRAEPGHGHSTKSSTGQHRHWKSLQNESLKSPINVRSLCAWLYLETSVGILQRTFCLTVCFACWEGDDINKSPRLMCYHLITAIPPTQTSWTVEDAWKWSQTAQTWTWLQCHHPCSRCMGTNGRGSHWGSSLWCKPRHHWHKARFLSSAEYQNHHQQRDRLFHWPSGSMTGHWSKLTSVSSVQDSCCLSDVKWLYAVL